MELDDARLERDRDVARALLGTEDDEIRDEREQRAQRHHVDRESPAPLQPAAPHAPVGGGRRDRGEGAEQEAGQADRAKIREAEQRDQQRDRRQRPRGWAALSECRQRRPCRGSSGAREHQPRTEPPERGSGEDDLDAVVLLEPAGRPDGDQRRRERRGQHAGERGQRLRVRTRGDRVAQPPRADHREREYHRERDQIRERLPALMLVGERGRQRVRRDRGHDHRHQQREGRDRERDDQSQRGAERRAPAGPRGRHGAATL